MKNGTIQEVRLSQLYPSPLNPRKSFPEEGILELADSIWANGLIEAITIRAIPPEAAKYFVPEGNSYWKLFDHERPQLYEVVCGERRLRAMQMICAEDGISTDTYMVPAIEREITDDEAKAIQIAENIQRESLEPMDEARAFQELIDMNDGWTVQEAAERTGKSASYVYRRLQLRSLASPWQLALAKGTALLSHCMEICRLQAHDQEEIYQALHGKKAVSLSLAELRAYIENNYNLGLHGAQFDIGDASLFPEAGPCTACPKNTAFQSSLFPDYAHAICTDKSCFKEKKRRAIALSIAAYLARSIQPIMVTKSYRADSDAIEEIKEHAGIDLEESQLTPIREYDIVEPDAEGAIEAVIVHANMWDRGGQETIGQTIYVRKKQVEEESPHSSNLKWQAKSVLHDREELASDRARKAMEEKYAGKRLSSGAIRLLCFAAISSSSGIDPDDMLDGFMTDSEISSLPGSYDEEFNGAIWEFLQQQNIETLSSIAARWALMAAASEDMGILFEAAEQEGIDTKAILAAVESELPMPEGYAEEEE